MVERFVTDPIELPGSEDTFARADLLFYGIDHSGPSFEARLFLDDEPAGSFFIFGHGGCHGEAGHCDIPPERDPHDIRPPHQLEPAERIVTVTDVVRALVSAGKEAASLRVEARAAGAADNDVLAFDTVRLATYA